MYRFLKITYLKSLPPSLVTAEIAIFNVCKQTLEDLFWRNFNATSNLKFTISALEDSSKRMRQFKPVGNLGYCTTLECPRREGTCNLGFDYEYLIPTLFALRTVERSDIIDMSLATNVKDMGAFDDLILYLEYQNQKSVYIIQLKHKKEPITASSLKHSRDYAIYKYQKDYEKILEQSKISEFEVLENVPIENMYFIIYTSSKLSLPLDEKIMKHINLDIIKADSDKQEFSLLNTNVQKEDCIYKFRKTNMNIEGVNEKFLSQFYLFTSQGQIDVVEDLIQKLLNSMCGYQNESIKLVLLNYIRMWERGDLRLHYRVGKIIEEGFKNSNDSFKIQYESIFKKLEKISTDTHYKLRKRDVQLELTEMLLNPYIVEPKSFLKFKNEGLWNDIVDSADITIVEECNEEMVSIIWNAANTKFSKYCGKKLKEGVSWEWDNWLTMSDLPKKYKQRYSKSLNALGNINAISMKFVYFILWRNGYVPLLLKTSSIKDVNNITKALGVSQRNLDVRKVVLLHQHEDQTLHHLFKVESAIRSLGDISNPKILLRLLENMMVSLQGRKPVQLSKLIDTGDAISRDIPMNLIVTMLYQPLIVGTPCNDLPENYIKRRIGRVLLQSDVLELQSNAFIIYGSSSIMEDIQSITGSQKVIDGRNYFQQVRDVEGHLPNVVALELGHEMSLAERQHFKNNANSIHYLRYYDGYLEWLHSVGPIDDIRRFVQNNATKHFIDEDDALTHFISNVNIISSNPGMGKSVMINCLARKCREDYWVKIIILSEYSSEFGQKISEKVKVKKCNFYQRFTNALIDVLKEKRKVLYLIDAFDEILPCQTNSIVAGLKFIKEQGFSLWITTRPARKSELERKFNVCSLSLNPVNAEDQTLYLRNCFIKKKKKNVDLFVQTLQNIISKCFSKLDFEFSSVPLHLYMIAEVFDDKSVDQLLSWKSISTIDLYETFILKKIKIYLSRLLGDNVSCLNTIYKREYERTRSQHAKAALLIFYEHNILREVIDFQEIKEFLGDTNIGELNIGIITSVNRFENVPIFSHRTFAEYLAAEYLASHCLEQNIKPLLKLLFVEELTVVRQLFDRILAKDQPLHLAVLNNNLDEMKTLLNGHNDILHTDYDLGGRTPLHLAAAWGVKHRFPDSNEVSKVKDFLLIHINQPDHKVTFENATSNEILRIIYDTKKYINQTDKIFAWHPSDYAKYSYSLDALDTFMEKDRSIDILECFDMNSLIFYCVKYGYQNILEALPPLVSYISNGPSEQNLFHIVMDNQQKCFDILQILFRKFNSRLIKLYLWRLNQEGNSPLMCAALNGNISAFKSLLERAENFDLNKHNVHGLTLLHYLVFYNFKECIIELLKNPSIDINKKTKKNCKQDHTALYFAVNNNNLDIVKILIENRADIHLPYENKRTVLHVASINGFIDCIKELHYSGADINTSDENGKTPLHYAVQNTQIKSVEYLLQLGADVNKADTFGRTFVHYAVQNLNLENLKLFDNFAFNTLNTKDRDGRTLVHYAIRRIKVEKIDYLLPLGKKHNHWHHYRSTPFHRAFKEDKLCNIKFLIRSGGNINETDNCGRTALQYAVEENNLETIEYLLELGADINKSDRDNRTPLFNAVQFGKINVIKWLLDSNADVNKYDTSKRAPIHVATAKTFIACVRMLITSGANINLSASDGCTPLFIAIMKNNDKLVKLLVESGANVNKSSQHSFNYVTSECSGQLTEHGNSLAPLHMAIQLKNINIIRYILESKVKINQTDSNGWTALHFAASNNCIECVDDLVRKGAGLHFQSANKCTPIHLATMQNNVQMLETLLNASNCKKAIDKCDVNLHTALHLACTNGYLQCAKILVNKGADVQVCTSEGFTPLDLAIKHEHKDVQNFLEHWKTLPGDRRVKEKEAEKVLKYKELALETQRMWNCRTKVIP
ncbi:hypothetical protein ILUMI_07160, partial [Ignelater luminosus]